jgi:hypothetical protein
MEIDPRDVPGLSKYLDVMVRTGTYKWMGRGDRMELLDGSNVGIVLTVLAR